MKPGLFAGGSAIVTDRGVIESSAYAHRISYLPNKECILSILPVLVQGLPA